MLSERPRLESVNEPLTAKPAAEQTKADESRHQHELHALIDLTAALGASTDIDISLRVLLERMVWSFGAVGGECRLLATPDDSNLLAQHGLDPGDEATALRRAAVRELSEHAFRRREPLYLGDLTDTAHRARRELMRSTGFRALLCVPLLNEQEPLGTLTLYYREPREFSADERDLLFAIGKQLGANIVRSRLYEAERGRADTLHRSYTLLVSLSHAVANLQDLTSADEWFRRLLKELLRRRLHSALLVPDPDESSWRLRGISLQPSTLQLIEKYLGFDLLTTRLRVEQVPRLLPTIRAGTPLVLSNVPLIAHHWLPQVPQRQLDHVLLLAGFVRQRERPLVLLPLRIDGNIEGLLLLWGGHIKREDLPAFTVFAHHIANALRALRLREQVDLAHERLRRLTTQVMTIQEEERARISRELHDEAGQALTALKIELSLLAHELPAESPTVQQRMRETLSQVDDLLAAIRRMAHEMHPPALETLGLSATLEGYCEMFGQRTRISLDYQAESPRDPSPSASIALYRILQEALTNVARHAEATHVEVALTCDDHSLTLSVQDDGRGFDAQQQAGGLGLAGMRERIDAIGGWLQVESELDVGTTLTVHVPLPSERNDG